MLNLTKKVKAMMFITIIIITLSAASILILIMEPCEYCHKKFCFGSCLITYDDEGNKTQGTIKPKLHKTNQNSTRLTETERQPQSYMDNIVFIGDSRTVGLSLNADLKPENIFADGGLNHEEALTKKVVKIQEYKTVSIPEAVRITAPSIMVINFGINGIAWMSIDTFMEGYEKLIDELITNSPNSIIVIESIMPVSLGYEQTKDGVSNEKIDLANNALFEMAKQKGLYYMATDEVLKNDSNDLISSFHGGDGIHFNKQAYGVIVDYMLTHAIYKVK